MDKGQHFEAAFVSGCGGDCKTAKALLKKIYKHEHSSMHADAAKSERQKHVIVDGINKTSNLYVKQNQAKIEFGLYMHIYIYI